MSQESLTASQGLSGLGTLVKAGGQVLGGLTAQRTAEYNAAVLEQEAALTRALEPIVRGEAAIEAQRIRQEGRRITGAQRAGYAAAGVSVSKGSPMLVMLDSIFKAGEDAFLARYKGDVRAWELESRAVGLRSGAAIRREMGRQSFLGSLMGAGGTLIEGSTAFKGKAKIPGEDPWDLLMGM